MVEKVLEHGSFSVEGCQLVLVTPGTLGLFWEQVAPILEVGREYWEEFATIDSIVSSIVLGQRDLWLACDDGGVFLVMLTEISTYPTKSSFRILWIGGSNLKRALPFLDYIELLCARKGIKLVEVAGRPGWLRVLEKNGYVYRSTLMAKDISELREH